MCWRKKMPKIIVNEKEIEFRNNYDPLVKKTGDNIPYLIDQHLLEKENA